MKKQKEGSENTFTEKLSSADQWLHDLLIDPEIRKWYIFHALKSGDSPKEVEETLRYFQVPEDLSIANNLHA